MKLDGSSSGSGCTSCSKGSSSSSQRHPLLHHIRHRGSFHHLCTRCVLKFHTTMFCPTCFDLYDGSPPSDAVRCSKCSSSSHLVCAAGADSSSYVCRSCSDSNSPFSDKILCSIDLNSAKAVLVAARIAVVSMNRAASVARAEAERKVREAVVAKKRARDALERVTSVALKAKELKGIKGSSPPVMGQKKRPVYKSPKWIESRNGNRFPEVPLNNSGSKIPANDGVEEKIKLKAEDNSKLRGFSHTQNQACEDERGKNGVLPRRNHAVEKEKGQLKELTDSEMCTRVPQSKQDTAVSRANSGVMFAGSTTTGN